MSDKEYPMNPATRMSAQYVKDLDRADKLLDRYDLTKKAGGYTKAEQRFFKRIFGPDKKPLNFDSEPKLTLELNKAKKKLKKIPKGVDPAKRASRPKGISRVKISDLAQLNKGGKVYSNSIKKPKSL
tara:strand:+ start:44 stop:424 length:381 start_codon:yes stop_codon:yes gene_type:complete